MRIVTSAATKFSAAVLCAYTMYKGITNKQYFTLYILCHSACYISIMHLLMCERSVMPFAISKVYGQCGPDCAFQLDTITINLRTMEESHPSDSSTAVITLVIFHTSTMYTAMNSALLTIMHLY